MRLGEATAHEPTSLRSEGNLLAQLRKRKQVDEEILKAVLK